MIVQRLTPRPLVVSSHVPTTYPPLHPRISSHDVWPSTEASTFGVYLHIAGGVRSGDGHVSIAVARIIDASVSTDLPCSRVPGA